MSYLKVIPVLTSFFFSTSSILGRYLSPHRKLVRTRRRHTKQPKMHNLPQRSVIPALASLLSSRLVSNSIHHTVRRPQRTHDAHRPGVPEPRNQHGCESGRVVLVEVLVGALRAIEGDHCRGARGRSGLDLFVRGIFVGVGNFGGLASAANVGAVPDADEECGDAGEEDVAIRSS
jgi:hypothetical protein